VFSLRFQTVFRPAFLRSLDDKALAQLRCTNAVRQSMYMHGPACPDLVGLIFLAEEKRFSGSTASIETICPILTIYMIVTACS
jgi:hypothetical protein